MRWTVLTLLPACMLRGGGVALSSKRSYRRRRRLEC